MEERGNKGEPSERDLRAVRTKGSVVEEEEIFCTGAVSMAQIKRSSGRRVTLVLSKETSGSARQDKASVGPMSEPGI